MVVKLDRLGRSTRDVLTLRLYRVIATMDAAAPLPAPADQAPTWESASTLARSWGLKQLADPLTEKA